MTPADRTRASARPIARATAVIRAEAETSLRDSMVYGLGAALAVLIAGLSLAAL